MNKPALVLLHGWGCDSRSWQPLIEPLAQLVARGEFADLKRVDLPGFGEASALEEFSLNSVLAYLVEQIPDNSTVIGWSLGGILAVHLAYQFPHKVARLITLGANAKFVATTDYPTAMPPRVNRQFNAGFAADAAASLKLFSGLLAQGDAQERALLKKIRSLFIRSDLIEGAISASAGVVNASPNHNWAQALTLLANLDSRQAFVNLTQPGLHLFAEHDALVPVAAADAMALLNSKQQISVVAGAAHALHWSQPQKVFELMANFMAATAKNTAQPAYLDKKKIAQSFSRAAATYDAVADLQRRVGHKLLQTLAEVNTSSPLIDLGCGTGYFTEQLAGAAPATRVIGVDIAEGMLQFARARNIANATWLCGDAEALPLANNTTALIFSSLALQWCQDLPKLMAELWRVLEPGGRLIFSTLGPNTLHELKRAWSEVDDYVHVNRFYDKNALQQELQAAGFAVEQFVQSEEILYFEKLTELTRELKALGAHNVNAGQARGLTGRARITAFKNAYEHYRSEQGLPATYDVFYICARK